ncbi:MAG: RNA polymerase sigma factor [Paracoccaceae bacterium]
MDVSITSAPFDPINLHMPDLQRYAHYLCDTPEQAQVIVQKAVERVLSRQDRHGPVEDLKSYLFSILYNLRNDQLRQKQKRQNEVNIEDITLTDTAPGPAQRLTCLEVLAHIDNLPQSQRDIFRHLIRDNLSYAEISVALNIPKGTVMSRLSRARKALRMSMDMKPASTVGELLAENA